MELNQNHFARGCAAEATPFLVVTRKGGKKHVRRGGLGLATSLYSAALQCSRGLRPL
jgi:hypothetical protein